MGSLNAASTSESGGARGRLAEMPRNETGRGSSGRAVDALVQASTAKIGSVRGRHCVAPLSGREAGGCGSSRRGLSVTSQALTT